MNRMETDKPDDIKRGSDGKYYVEKVIKMRVKEGREEFLEKLIDYPLSEATWEPFENLSGKEAGEYQVILIHTNSILVNIIALIILIKDEEALAIRGENGKFSSKVK